MRISEGFIQQSIYVWFNNNYCLLHHSPRCIIFSIPNESENGWEAKKKSNIGLLSGVSDLCILLPDGKTLFVEVKTETSIQSKNQKIFEQRVKELGFNYYLVRSLLEFQNIIKQHIIWQNEY